MIFVTVGTHEQPFNRLIQKVDELKKDGTIQDDVIIQTGFSTYEPKYCQWSKLIPYQQMVKNVADTSNLNITYIYRVGAFLLAMMLQMIGKQIVFKRNERKESMMVPLKWTDRETVFYIIGLGTSSLGMFFSFLSRLGMYYLMYEMVFWGRAVKEGKSRRISLALSLIYAIYVFGMELVYNGSKIFPYGIHWF